ncbi:AAA domain-containing protein [Bradyrhizobium lablabi]|uniref:AAA domain-containing protein n=2 Tax=Bradyrhizobium lablabi TaxID=722472 RepID=A0A1H5LQB0_9BRAD|nr:AAA domain-containing protein [Bradyrhizobium lablabi]
MPVTVMHMDEHWMTMGRKKVAAGVALWRASTQANRWPGYPHKAIVPEYPGWQETKWLDREEAEFSDPAKFDPKIYRQADMTFHFAPAVRESVTLLIALAGASGSGKTFSALRLAKGMAPTGKIAFIDTEARRGLHYAEEFDFLHSDMRPPFRPAAFIEGIRAAEAAGAEVVIIDSFSHEYDGQGGIMDWADELEADGTKSPGNWKVPKGAHKKLMNALLQCRASIIFCLRADEKIRIARENGKTVVEPLGWMPICEKRFMFEMTASFTLTPDRPGIPHFDLPHKLQRQHRDMFTDKKPIGEDSGAALAEWARGGAPAPPPRNSNRLSRWKKRQTI